MLNKFAILKIMNLTKYKSKSTMKRETKKNYQTPVLIKVGTLTNITLKTGSTSDSTLPRVV